jgi:flagellar hook-associated protein 3 FlgL
MMFRSSVDAMMKREAELLRTQQQLSSGKRMLSPSDDPIAAGQAVTLRDRQSVAAQYAGTLSAAEAQLGLLESRLGEAIDVLQAGRELLVASGNGAYTDAERAAVALELRARRDQLLGIANSADAEGRRLFAGYQDSQDPFSDTAAGVTYGGDQGRRALAIGPARELAVSASGHAVFELGRSGNSAFEVSAAAANTGSGTASIGRVYDASLVTNGAYRVVFGAAGTYDVLDAGSGATLSSGNPWTSGQAIRFAGLEFSVQGAPAAGDRYELAPSTAQSVFRVFDEAIALLSAPQAGAAGRARFATGLANTLAEIDSSLEHMLLARAEAGAGLREVQEARAANEARELHLAAQLSALEDLDVAQAASELARQKLALEAAQRAHVLTSGLSLFDYL